MKLYGFTAFLLIVMSVGDSRVLPKMPLHCLLAKPQAETIQSGHRLTHQELARRRDAARAMAATAQLPPPGNPEHKEPPPGEFCQHGGDAAHSCTCHRECKDSDELDENGEPTGRRRTDVTEDTAKCRSSCFKSHCHCPVANCE